MKHFSSIFKHKRILVIGDIMLDEYIFGTITKKSPEAPKTPVILVDRTSYVLGGAANVANNIVSLGGTAVLVGSVGADESGTLLKALVKKSGIKDGIFTSRERPTTVKTRLFAGERQHARIDTETTRPLSKKELISLSKTLHTIHNVDLIIISDYAKGVFSEKMAAIVRTTFPDKKIIVDPKPIHKNLLKNFHLITPNLKEMSSMAGVPLKRHADIRVIALALTQELNTSVLATLGRDGMLLCEKSGAMYRIPLPRRIRAVDVTGAGDVATAACTLALAAGASLLESARFANHAAAVSVTKLGTATVRLSEIANR